MGRRIVDPMAWRIDLIGGIDRFRILQPLDGAVDRAP
jgi:hypothetical protein